MHNRFFLGTLWAVIQQVIKDNDGCGAVTISLSV